MGLGVKVFKAQVSLILNPQALGFRVRFNGSMGIKTGFVRIHLEGYQGVSKGYVRLRVLKLAASREQNGDIVKGVI